MRGYYRYTLVATLGIVAIAWIVLDSESFRNCIQSYVRPSPHRNFDNIVSDFLLFWGDRKRCLGPFIEINEHVLTAASTVFIALFTFTLWYSTHRLWLASRDQSEDTKTAIAESARSANAMEGVAASLIVSAKASTDSVELLRTNARMQMRAFLGITTGEFAIQNPETGYRFEFRPRIVNTGFTPARAVFFTSVARVFPFPLPDEIDLTLPIEDSAGAGTINAGQFYFVRAVLDRILPEDELTALKTTGDHRIYVYGRVQYRDVFGDPHFTNFCQFVLWERDDLITYINSRRHNDSD
jgi:hypothetical protein